MCRKYFVWSRAVICDRPQTCAITKRVMPARRARRLIAALPTMSRIRVAATLSERWIMGARSALSAAVSGRPAARRRYVVSSIALNTLADGTWVSSPRPSSRSSVRTANVISPRRPSAYRAAPAMSGCHFSACAAAGQSAATRATAARRRMSSVYGRMSELGPSTRAIHAGLPEPQQGEPLLPGPVLAAPYHLRGATDSAPYGYGRDQNPTWTNLERALGELDGGEAVVFSSGMAAVSAIVLPRLRSGDVLVAPRDAYPGIRKISEQDLSPRGV